MILNIILYLLVFIIFIILAVISLPYYYFYKIKYKNYFYQEIKVETVFFKIKYMSYKEYNITIINIINYQKVIKKDKVKDKIKDKNKKASDKKSKKSFPLKIISRDNINHVLGFIIKVYKLIKPDIINLDFLISLDDPYYNGLILAYYHTLKGVYPHMPIHINVNWQEEVIECQGRIAGKIIPVALLYHLLIFIFSHRTIKILWQIFKHKK